MAYLPTYDLLEKVQHLRMLSDYIGFSIWHGFLSIGKWSCVSTRE